MALIEQCSPLARRGSRPHPPEPMLRLYLMQKWVGLSDLAMVEVLHERTPMRAFAGLTLTTAILDDTTILNFRYLLESN